MQMPKGFTGNKACIYTDQNLEQNSQCMCTWHLICTHAHMSHNDIIWKSRTANTGISGISIATAIINDKEDIKFSVVFLIQ